MPATINALAALVALAVSTIVVARQDKAPPYFSPPAGWDDFKDCDQDVRAAFREQWSNNIERWTEYGIVGNPWTGQNDDDRSTYINPTVVPVPADAVRVVTKWFAFPHRLSYYGKRNDPPYTKDEIYQLADFGFTRTGRGFPNTPDDLLDPNSPLNQTWTWGPPRGWCDEYCEWAVRREGDVIKRIDFTCENPEYWTTMWGVDRERVRALIESLVRYPVALEDLYLRDGNGDPVIDVATGLPAYDPLNKWNRGTISTPEGGGAIHLTSPPNSLGAEIYLAAAASILREEGGEQIRAAHNLICCSLYGGVDRNSDPHIGQNVNQVAAAGLQLTLANPVGLYIQDPEFNRFELPLDKVVGDITVEDCWTMVRGYPGGFGLHARFEVPEGQNFEINDIKIDGQAIQYAGQIAEAFEIGLHAVGFKTPGYVVPKPRPCVWHSKSGALPPGSTPQPGQPVIGEAVFAQQSDARPQLAFSPPQLEQGSVNRTGFVLPCAGLDTATAGDATVTFVPSDDPGNTTAAAAVVVGVLRDQSGAPEALKLSISVGSDAPLGNYGAIVRGLGDEGPITPAPGMLEVVAPSR